LARKSPKRPSTGRNPPPKWGKKTSGKKEIGFPGTTPGLPKHPFERKRGKSSAPFPKPKKGAKKVKKLGVYRP